VLTVGGIEPRKGSMTLLEGFAQLRRLIPELDPLLIVAGGATLFDYREERERFETRASELEVSAHLRQVGNLSDAKLARLYRAADLFAFPSVKEGFGLAALEALASGLPVVASDLEAFRSFLDHDDTALLIPAGDSRALAAALARLAREPETRERLRRSARAAVATHTWDASAAGHERVYGEFLAGRGGISACRRRGDPGSGTGGGSARTAVRVRP
jgi:glycosyltransferase involved in cell wall biosynthesis